MTKLLTLLLAASLNSHAATLAFKLKGQPSAAFSETQIKSRELKGLKAIDITLYNVFRGYERTYEGYDFFVLLDNVYGKDWRKQKKISFIAADGYNQFAFIPAMLNAAKNKAPYLVFSEKGKNGFTLIEKQGKLIDPGPLYLVWSNFSEADKASHADTLKWPYQLATISVD